MWQPRPRQQEILDKGWAWKESVPYETSARWIFYKLYDKDHLFDAIEVAPATLARFRGNRKSWAYKDIFLPLFSKARKQFHGNWRPDSLTDDSRVEFLRGFGWANEREWLEVGIGDQECLLDKWQDAENYVEGWFEAFAMKGQFDYFAPDISLVPFRGDASIEYKWRMAKRLEEVSERYGKPIKILYFGDADKKGGEIPQNALRDIRAWCDVPFEFIHCGLSAEQAQRFGLGESIDQPSSYQWESLSHDQAGELIVPNVERVISRRLIGEIEAREQEATRKFREIMRELLK